MSQGAILLPGSPLTGAAAAADINSSFAAITSKYSGNSAPTIGPGASGALVAFQSWFDTVNTIEVHKLYDGAQFLPFMSMDTVNHLAWTPQALRNVIDNGGFEVWQRGAGSSSSFAVGASSTAYTADRWYVTTGANEASVISAVTGLVNGLGSNSNIAAKMLRNNGQTGTTAYIFGYPLDTDELLRLRGQKVSLQVVAKAGANWSPASGTLTVNFYVGTGAVGKRGGGFTSETTVLTGSVNLAVSTQGIITATSAATVPTTATQGELQFTWTPVGTAGADDSIQIDDVQLETGVFASLFERLPFDFLLPKLKRHYRKTFPYGTAPVQNGALAGSLGVVSAAAAQTGYLWGDSIPMRVTPTITTYNPTQANANWRDQTAAADLAVTVDTNNPSPEHVLIIAAAAAAANHLIYIHAQADAGI